MNKNDWKKNLTLATNNNSCKMIDYKDISRHEFMQFFRDDEKLNELSIDDRIEIFSQIVPGCSYFTKELLDEIFIDYSVSHLEIIEIENGKE